MGVGTLEVPLNAAGFWLLLAPETGTCKRAVFKVFRDRMSLRQQLYNSLLESSSGVRYPQNKPGDRPPPPLHVNVAEHAASASRLRTLTWRGRGGAMSHQSKLDLSGGSFCFKLFFSCSLDLSVRDFTILGTR